MKRDIAKNQMCIFIRGGVELWVDKDKIQAIEEEIKKGGVFRLEENVIRGNDVIGIFKPEVIAERARRKNGEWVCSYGKWHEKFKKCQCSVENMTGDELAKYSQRGY